MGNPFFEHPILNSPYAYPTRHWELDADGQPTQQIKQERRQVDFVTPIPKPRHQHDQAELDNATGLSTAQQQYAQAAAIRQVREHVDRWRQLPESQWRVTPETAHLLKYWRKLQRRTDGLRPFFCQTEAAETAIWLTEVAPDIGNEGKGILAAITEAHLDDRPMLDPYNPEGSTAHVNFTTTRANRWETRAERCHVNYAILDSDWEDEFCRVVEDHPQVLAYVKNQRLGFEVPYRHGPDQRTYIPDCIVRADDGHGPDDPLNLVVEIKGYRGEDAKEKATTMRTYWVPNVNHLGEYGCWAFAEFTDVWAMQEDFAKVIAAGFGKILDDATTAAVAA